MNRIFLLCNAHLDPVWQWDLDEGLGAAISTFRCAADFCEENQGFIFNHNEALLYRFVEEAEPELFARIQRLVKEGKWNIMGGFELQPDCVMPSGEAYIRQIICGQRYFAEKFGVHPTVAVNFDSFGHSRGLAQILKKCGYIAYVFMRPQSDRADLPCNFRWVGFDGSEIIGHRLATVYNSAMGKNAEQLLNWVEEKQLQGDLLYTWGVGNHGGGPSRKDIADIDMLIKNGEPKGYTLIHSTPEEYFSQINKDDLPIVDHSLYPIHVGCYTSMVDVKQTYRRLESALFTAEKLAAAAMLQTGMRYPAEDLDKAFEHLVFMQFHDFLPGTMVETAKRTVLNKAGAAFETADRIRRTAFYALAGKVAPGASGTIPVMVYNPHPYPVTETISCEFSLADQNWVENELTIPEVMLNGKTIPSQLEKEECSVPLDWRKRVIFEATLEPMSMHRFDCALQVKEKSSLPPKSNRLCFDNGTLKVDIDEKTGWISALYYQGHKITGTDFGALTVFADDFDPWHMRGDRIDTVIDRFTLLEGEALRKFLGVCEAVPAIRVIEDGEVRTVVEASFGYGYSFANVKYFIPKHGSAMEIEVELICNEKDKMIKMALPSALQQPQLFAETMFGTEPAYMDGTEYVSHRFDILKGDGGFRLAVINDGVYGGSVVDGIWYKNLLRTPAFCAHPLEGRQTIPSDRYISRMDCGKSVFRFRIMAGDASLSDYEVALQSQQFNEPAIAFSMFPKNGDATEALSQSAVSVDGKVLVSAIGQPGATLDTHSLLLRLYEPQGQAEHFSIQVPAFHLRFSGEIGPFEVKTYRISADGVEETMMNDYRQA